MLMQPDARLSHRVGTVVGRASETGVLKVGHGQTHFERHDSLYRIVACNEHGLQHHVLTRGQAVEVHQGNLVRERRAQRAVVRLIDIPGAVVVDDTSGIRLS